MKKIALGMSGGVDSSLCAHLLVEQGYEVTGVYLECWRAPGCRSEEDRKDALKVALELNIPFKVLDFKDAYKNKVVEYFFEEYENGRTPNPDILCNSEIKFGLFYDWAMENGFDAVATGHYADIQNLPKSLTTPKDAHKDQTYFLYRLREDQLDHIIFPLADLNKDEVRDEAQKRNIHVADKKDSVGICFIGDIDVTKFLKERLGEKPGSVVDTKGNIIGTHKGIWFYTIGQRHGFQIDKKTLIKQSDGSTIEKQNIPPFYVIGKDAKKNQLIVGFGSETYTDTFKVTNTHWINKNSQLTADSLPAGRHGSQLSVRIRHTGKLISCSIDQSEKNKDEYVVKLNEPTQGIAEGQSAVFYTKSQRLATSDQNTCLGGGIIGY